MFLHLLYALKTFPELLNVFVYNFHQFCSSVMTAWQLLMLSWQNFIWPVNSWEVKPSNFERFPGSFRIWCYKRKPRMRNRNYPSSTCICHWEVNPDLITGMIKKKKKFERNKNNRRPKWKNKRNMSFLVTILLTKFFRAKFLFSAQRLRSCFFSSMILIFL